MNVVRMSFYVVALSLATAACGDGGDGGDGGGNDSVEDVLDDLGIDTTETPRVDGLGDPLPDEYSPLGSSRTINPFAEIMIFGVQLDDTPASTGQMPVLDIQPAGNNSFDWELLDDEAPASTPWFDDRGYPRAAARGDFDGDGHDEVAVLYQEPGDPVHLIIKDDASDNFATSAPKVVSTVTARGIFVASGDVDGDGDDDLVVAIELAPQSLMAETEIYVLTNDDGSFTSGPALHTLEPPAAGTNYVSLAIGNLDYDSALETALVLNNTGIDQARYFIYDDARNGLSELKSGVVNLTDAEGAVETAVVADVAIGDVDGDGTDEVILGGLDYRGNVRDQEPDYLVEVFDDAPHDFAHLAGNRVSSNTGGLQPSSSGASQHLRYLHVLAADIDGDGAHEIVSNQFVYEDLRQSPGILTAYQDANGAVEIPLKDLFCDGNAGDDYFFDWDTSDMAAGDVTSDKRENVVLYSQRLTVFGETQELQVWGLDMIEGWSEMLDIESTFDNPINQDGQKQPQILLADLDQDNESMALEYSDGSYRFVFTEPIVLAVLAAAPCAENLGQDLGESCRTAFGQGIFESEERENGWSFVVGVDVGYKFGLPGGNVEALVETRNTIRGWTIDTYSTTKRVLRETGAIEDSVILTSIPMDIYTYEILSHPDPALIGQEIEIRMPREPITVMVQRDVFNDALEEGGPRIDDSVFTHIEGDPVSYPTRAEKDALLNRYKGLETEEVDVGQGTGQTTVSINEFESTTDGSSYEFLATLNLKATAGSVIGGFTIGGGGGFSLEITRGTENIYEGSVGNVSEEHFPGDAYSWGLMSYIQDDHPSGQTFEVINYWVQP